MTPVTTTNTKTTFQKVHFGVTRTFIVFATLLLIGGAMIGQVRPAAAQTSAGEDCNKFSDQVQRTACWLKKIKAGEKYLVGADLRGLKPTDMSLRNVDLIKADLRQAYLNGAYLKSARLQFSDLSNADLTGARMETANLGGANLTFATLRNVELNGVNLVEADLREANLTGSDLSYVNLRRAKLVATNLTGVNLTGADLRGLNLSKANLRLATLVGANLTGADLREANLRWMNLRGINLLAADLTKADLRNADLTGANLGGAYLNGADLTGADLTGAIMTGIRTDAKTKGLPLMLPLKAGTVLKKGMKFASPLGNNFLIVGQDGNLMVRNKDDVYVWGTDQVIPGFGTSTAKVADRVEFQSNGNLVSYHSDGTVLWKAPITRTDPKATLNVTPNGILQVVAANGEILWASKK